MYKVTNANGVSSISKLEGATLTTGGFKERFDLERWLVENPNVLGEQLLIVKSEYILPSGIRLDILALDREGKLVVVELKRDHSGIGIDWQAVKYASYCSTLTSDAICQLRSDFSGDDLEETTRKIEDFIDGEIEDLNQDQRIILVSGEFHPDVMSAVFWLRDHEIDVRCVRLRCFNDDAGALLLNPELIVPLPEAEDYLVRQKVKSQKDQSEKGTKKSSFSIDKGSLDDTELKEQLLNILSRTSPLTPRIATFLDILLSEDRTFNREEIKRMFFERGIGADMGRSGALLSNVSQFLTKKPNAPLRQIITFSGDAEEEQMKGQVKEHFRLIDKYRSLVRQILDESKLLSNPLNTAIATE
jgi:hypothetical protein